MVFEKILIPTDGSKYTEAAVSMAIEIAKLSGGKITALYVIDQTLLSNNPMNATTMSMYNILKMEGENATNSILNLGKSMGIDVDAFIKDGVPVKVILKESINYDIIIMGTLGRTGISKLLMGSVAEKVVRASQCPVMIVKSPEVVIK